MKKLLSAPAEPTSPTCKSLARSNGELTAVDAVDPDEISSNIESQDEGSDPANASANAKAKQRRYLRIVERPVLPPPAGADSAVAAAPKLPLPRSASSLSEPGLTFIAS
jgi:hypothetical protein